MAAPRNVSAWIGWGLSVLLALLFALSAYSKLVPGKEAIEGMAKAGFPESMLFPLAIVEITCVVLYLIPHTSVIGAILLTGYMGGTIVTHWRIGEAFYLNIAIGVLIWVAICMRENRLWYLIPIRTAPPANPPVT